ncbi:unnamed protein product [Adineta steineri]|uniref:G-protein coupled receptors family 1 profile domain-containing protein n=1 Tax=Adineta steineri TaxID=433720 RepID=A0A813VAP1_9BILA|nr:unnamed protein product [Adineta steineri]CAF0833966.1 unnamed protein product [Adineta steineri]CAF3650602.1 unnamed protein product [Adineta steineri]CAF4119486.1 unnamed protein product [Adineta steineri]
METLANNRYLIHRIKFFVVLFLEISAIILFLLIFLFFITNRRYLNKLQNQALLILFIVNFIQLSLGIPILMHFLRFSRVTPETSIYCKTWMYIESTLDAANEFLVAVISIQRHILIFRPNLLNIRFKLYLLYYLPLLFCIIYPIIFYMSTIILYSCDDAQWNFTLNMCGDTICYFSNNAILAGYDWIVNTGLPIMAIILGNIILVIRVIKQKHRRQRTVSWSKQRHMTLQLISISSLYLVTWLPSIIIGLSQQINPSDYLYGIGEYILSDLTYLVCLLLPWMSLGLLPDFKKWLLKLLRHVKKPTNIVGTTTLKTRHN